MQTVTRKLIVTTPYYREAAIVPDCRATVHALRDAGMCVAPEWVMWPGPLVYKNRNAAIRYALTIPDWTHLLTLDADISLPDPVADVQRLLDADVDIIGGAYTMRFDDGPDMLCAARLDSGHVATTSTGRHEVDWTGGGCILMRRACIEALGPLWFRHEFNADATDQTPEDVGFCQWARAHGYKIWLDCDIHAVHHQLHNRGGTGMDGITQPTVEDKQRIIQEKIDACIRGIYSLTIDTKAAEITGNTKSMEKIEKALSETMKQKAAYEQLLKEVK